VRSARQIDRRNAAGKEICVSTGHENRPFVHTSLNAPVDLRERWRFDHGMRESFSFSIELKSLEKRRL